MLRKSDVTNVATWKQWAQQELGVGWIRRRGKTNASAFIEEYGLPTLIRLTEFCKEKGHGKSMRTVDSVPLFYEQAKQSGWFAEDKRERSKVQVWIDTALYLESDPTWIRRLLSAKGEPQQRKVYEQWESARS